LNANRGLRQILSELAAIIQDKNAQEEKEEENQIDVE